MSAITGVDFTFPCTGITKEELVTTLRSWCKKWVFQREKGESGYEHFQGRVSLIKKKRFNDLKGKFLHGGHISPTTDVEYNGKNFSYVLKEDTRIEGPWDDKSCPPPPKMTKRLASFLQKDMYPWQLSVQYLVTQYDDRKIHVIIDKEGNCGKSTLAEYLEYKGLAEELPPLRMMEDIMACVMCIGERKAYLIDMPRGMKKDKLGEFYSGLECLKNGVAYDKRYAFKKMRFDCPQIIVFTNTEPVMDLLSRDRWQLHKVSRDGMKLVSYFDPSVPSVPRVLIEKISEGSVLQAVRPPPEQGRKKNFFETVEDMVEKRDALSQATHLPQETVPGQTYGQADPEEDDSD